MESAKSIVHGEITLGGRESICMLPRCRAHQPRNMSLGSKLTSTSCHASYYEAGRRNGWQRRTALVAASAAIWNKAFLPRLSTIGSPAREPSRLRENLTVTTRSFASVTPTGGFQQLWSWALSIAISFCDSCGAFPVVEPRVGVGLIMVPV